jgi:hypothetical protein
MSWGDLPRHNYCMLLLDESIPAILLRQRTARPLTWTERVEVSGRGECPAINIGTPLFSSNPHFHNRQRTISRKTSIYTNIQHTAANTQHQPAVSPLFIDFSW